MNGAFGPQQAEMECMMLVLLVLIAIFVAVALDFVLFLFDGNIWDAELEGKSERQMNKAFKDASGAMA